MLHSRSKFFNCRFNRPEGEGDNMRVLIILPLLLALMTAGCVRNYRGGTLNAGKPDGAPLAGETLKEYADRAALEAAHGDRITPVPCIHWSGEKFCRKFNQCVIAIPIDLVAKDFTARVMQCA